MRALDPQRGTARRVLRLCLGGGSLLFGVLILYQCGKPPPPPATKPPPPLATKPPAPPAIPRASVDTPSPACAEQDQKLAELYAPFLDAFSNRGLELSPDGKTLLFLSDRGGGSYQLYVAPVDRPAAEPTAIALAKDGVADARFSPDGLYVLFLRDQDKNENTQLYRATVDGKEVVALTKAPQRFHLLPRVAPDWKTMVYLRGVQKTGEMTLVAQTLDGGAEKVVMTARGFHELADLSPDGKRALVSHLISLSRSELLLVEVESGQSKVLAPTKGVKAHASAAAFSADGKNVYVVTDEGSDRAVLRRIDAEKQAVLATFADPQGEVAQVVASRRLPVVAVKIDYGSHTTIKLLDATSLKEKTKVKLPLGLIELGELSADGAELVITVSSPSSPTEVFALNAMNGKIKPLRREKRTGLRKITPPAVKVELLPTFDKLQIPTNVYLPKRLPRGKRLPVIVYVHGGPAAASAIRWNPLVGFWIARGFAVVEPNVRGSTGFGKEYEKADNGRRRMDAVRDLAEVNQWVRKQRWADTDRIVVLGGSYGGYLTYMALGHQPALWRVGVGLVGVVNLHTFLKNTTGAIRLTFREEFGSLESDGPFLKEVSPITAVNAIKAPLFVYQGENDPRVPRSEQDQLVLALREQKVPVEYMVAPDEGHSVSQRSNKLEFVSRSMRFLEQHLGLLGPSERCTAPTTGKAAAGDASGEEPKAGAKEVKEGGRETKAGAREAREATATEATEAKAKKTKEAKEGAQ